MIVLGDIASPNQKCTSDLKNIFDKHAPTFGNDALVCNFEGLVCDEDLTNTNTPVLYNHSSVLKVLQEANVKAVGLANNHTLDLPDLFENTLDNLSNYNIAFTGAGRSKAEASKPVKFLDADTEIILFNYCWDFLLYYQQNPTGNVHVAEIETKQLLTDLEETKRTNPGSKIIVYLHWSFDLEILPFPMFRQMAKAMIDAGANAVIGTHAHCVQGGEKYKEGYIVYGLGNFFIPYNTFVNGKLTFPDFSRIQLAWQWNPLTNESKCHWFRYKNDNGQSSLELIESSSFESSALLKSYSPYTGDDAAYLSYFKKNRRKKILVPVFKNYNDQFLNNVYTLVLKGRGKFARLLAKYNLRKWQT